MWLPATIDVEVGRLNVWSSNFYDVNMLCCEKHDGYEICFLSLKWKLLFIVAEMLPESTYYGYAIE